MKITHKFIEISVWSLLAISDQQGMICVHFTQVYTFVCFLDSLYCFIISQFGFGFDDHL